ncbi:MAG: GtrA family protein [Nitrosomonadales bacterium]|nr:GtrA family protein [Nitrosomonadales bacterium]
MKPAITIRLSIGSLFRRIFSRRFLKFGTVGASGTVVNLGLLYFAQEHIFTAVQQPAMRLNLSLALAIFFATLNNFFWNRLWTWADRKHHYHRPMLTQFGQYTLACWLSIVLQAIFTNALAPHFYYLNANLIAVVLTSVLNFVLNDIWTFGRLKLMGAQTSHHASPEQRPEPFSE